MPRDAREKSQTGIYHVMMRGIDKRDIFLADDDYEKFLFYIKKVEGKSSISLLAYCLMQNHVHLLIKEGKEEIGDSIRRITVGYAQYHNRNHVRTGHLFQNRYKSEPVDDDRYLLVVLRYIHQNPLRAGIVKNISNYKWSSYNDYLTTKDTIINKDHIRKYFPSIESYTEFHNQREIEQCMDYEVKKIYTEAELKEMIEDIIDIETLNKMEVQSRNLIIGRVKRETGASIRQLEQVLGIGRNIIQKA